MQKGIGPDRAVLQVQAAAGRVHPQFVCAKMEIVTTDPKLEGNFAVNDTHVVSLILLTSQLEMQLKGELTPFGGD